MRKWLSAVGSRLSGKQEHRRELPTPDSLQPTAPLPAPDNRQPTTDNLNWPLLYAAVLGELAILILIFYAFTKAFT
jgi:hypothetical protein